MNLTIENILLIGSALLILSILAGKTSYRFGVPTLVFFLLVGVLAGSEGIAGIYFDDPKIAQFIGIVALNFILFSGGLDTHWPTVKPVLWKGVTLSSLGVFATAISVGVFVYYVSSFSFLEALLLGAIVSSTDAAAVFSILRSKSIALKKGLRPILELESGSNDPMAYFLTIAVTGLLIAPEQGIVSLIPLFLKQVIIGVIAGFGLAIASKYFINRIRLDFEGLYPVLAVGQMFLVFSLTDFLGGNGFLAVYLCAVYLGNQELIHKKTIMRFFDGMAWLMQIVMFLTLGLLVFPSQILPVIGMGLMVSAFLIFVARPLSVWLTLWPFKISSREKWYVSWVGLKGAVPIVFATYPLIAGIESAGLIFNIVFFVSVTSILIQGTTLVKVSQWLKVSIPPEKKIQHPIDQFLKDRTQTRMIRLLLSPDCDTIGKRIVDLDFPKNAVIAMIKREGNYITPSGYTQLEALDELVVLVDDETAVDGVLKCLKTEHFELNE
nr:potassium/proton antiporter [Saprospiraceae bacterium]